MEFAFYNVNEEGEPYRKHDSIEPALAVLREFPNDTIVVTVVGTSIDLILREEV